MSANTANIGDFITARWFNLLKPKSYFICHQFHHSEFQYSAHNAFMCFCVDLRTNSDYFCIQN